MKTSRRTLQALFIALLLSAGCTLLLGRVLARRVNAQQSRMRRYLTVSHAIEPGEVLRIADLQALSWPASDPVAGALVNEQDLVGRVVLYPLASGQPLLERQFAVAGSGPGLASKIPTGMRAIALKSDEVVGVAGFLVPGSHVDVLVTYRSEGAAESIAATVLQNAEVIAAGQQTEPDPTGKAVSATVVTLLLTPQQAERALLASSQGVVHFVLRNSADTVASANVPVTLSELAGGAPARTPAASPRALLDSVNLSAGQAVRRPRPATAPAAVEVIFGGQSENAGNGGKQ